MRHDGDVILAQNAHWVKYTPACQFTHTMQTSMHISTVQTNVQVSKKMRTLIKLSGRCGRTTISDNNNVDHTHTHTHTHTHIYQWHVGNNVALYHHISSP